MCKSVFVCTNILFQCSSHFCTWTKNGKKTTKKTHKWYKNLRLMCTLLYYYERTNIYWMMNVFLRISISFLSFSHSVHVYFWLWFYFYFVFTNGYLFTSWHLDIHKQYILNSVLVDVSNISKFRKQQHTFLNIPSNTVVKIPYTQLICFLKQLIVSDLNLIHCGRIIEK